MAGHCRAITSQIKVAGIVESSYVFLILNLVCSDRGRQRWNQWPVREQGIILVPSTFGGW